jgi:hypothetical protein
MQGNAFRTNNASTPIVVVKVAVRLHLFAIMGLKCWRIIATLIMNVIPGAVINPPVNVPNLKTATQGAKSIRTAQR